MMRPADCEETKQSVHEYLHNELLETDIDAITAHLANCESCERSYDIEVVLNQVIQRSCDEAPTEELAQRVLRRLREVQNHQG
jgi:anti-sigma factor (TIGR02949 family)